MLTAITTTLLLKPAFAVLVFSKTAGFRHDSIPTGIECIQTLGKDNNFTVEATEDSTRFTTDNLKKYKVVIFLSTTQTVLDPSQKESFEAYIKRGGGYVGIHAAADTEYEWPFYGKLVGAYFKSHPRIQPAKIQVIDQKHVSTKHLPSIWEHTDEWYDYKEVPADDVHILMKLDTASYQGSTMGDNHPIAWCHETKGARAWYTGLGHTKEAYADSNFQKHVLGGILWAAKAK